VALSTWPTPQRGQFTATSRSPQPKTETTPKPPKKDTTMNQKQLKAEVDAVLAATAAAHGCTEAEARGLLGLTIRRLATTLVAATNPPATPPTTPAPATTEATAPVAA